MIFRRFATSLRKQDWAAVTVELVVVVVGVFIGLQASNWNEDRETNNKAAVFTERLRADLREEAWGYEAQVGYSSQVLANAKLAAGDLSGKTPLPDEALLITAYRATQYRNNIRRRATYDELTSTGEIGLIRDMALRDLAMRAYTSPMFDIILDEGINNPYRRAFRMAIPDDVAHTLAVTCGDHQMPTGDYRSIEHSLDYACSTGLSPQAITSAATTLRSDPRFLGFLRLRIAEVESNLNRLTVNNKIIRDGLRAIVGDRS